MSHGKKILVVEDDPDLAEILQVNLMEAGYQTVLATDGKKACALVTQEMPDLMMLDLMLPHVSGLDVLKFTKRRKDTMEILTIVMSAKDDEDTIVQALDAGAEDYIVKPCSFRETHARIKAVLRRKAGNEKSEKKSLSLDNLTIDFSSHQAHLNDDLLKLTKTEFDILWSLMKDLGQIFTRKQLLQIIHGPGIHTLDRNIDVHIVSLRKKLKSYGAKIETIRGIGYRLGK